MLFLEIPLVVDILLIILGLIFGVVGVFFFIKSKKNEKTLEASKEQVEKIIADAEADAERKRNQLMKLNRRFLN